MLDLKILPISVQKCCAVCGCYTAVEVNGEGFAGDVARVIYAGTEITVLLVTWRYGG